MLALRRTFDTKSISGLSYTEELNYIFTAEVNQNH